MTVATEGNEHFRAYAIEEYKPETEPFYVGVGDEEELFRAAFEQKIPVLLKGPTGCGKTRFVEYMAFKLGRPLTVVKDAGKSSALGANGAGVEEGGLPVVTVACHEDLTA
ncbi:MAG TPA: AAA family ATPase, partial [Dehalococcoidia bacterium]|nr:AAA family ATPase [Dehalococcoidia bacterium]